MRIGDIRCADMRYPIFSTKAKANLAIKLSEAGVEKVLTCWDSGDFLEKDVSSILDLFVPKVPH